MAVNTNPIFIDSVRSENAVVTTGAPTTPVTLITGGTDGSRVDSVVVAAVGTTNVAARYQILLVVSGGTARVLHDAVIDQITVSGGTAPFQETVNVNAFLKDNTSELQVVMTASPGANLEFTAHGGDF